MSIPPFSNFFCQFRTGKEMPANREKSFAKQRTYTGTKACAGQQCVREPRVELAVGGGVTVPDKIIMAT